MGAWRGGVCIRHRIRAWAGGLEGEAETSAFLTTVAMSEGHDLHGSKTWSTATEGNCSFHKLYGFLESSHQLTAIFPDLIMLTP